MKETELHTDHRPNVLIYFTDRPLARQIKYSDISWPQPLYFMVSRFHLICSVHKLTGCNIKFNMEKAYNEGSHLVCDEIVYNPSYGSCHVAQSCTVKWNKVVLNLFVFLSVSILLS